MSGGAVCAAGPGRCTPVQVEPALRAAGPKTDLHGPQPDGRRLDLLEQAASQASAAMRWCHGDQPQGHAAGRRGGTGPERQRAAEDAALVFGEQHERAVGGEAAGKLAQAPVVVGEWRRELRAEKVERLDQLLERGNRSDHGAHGQFVTHRSGRFTSFLETGGGTAGHSGLLTAAAARPRGSSQSVKQRVDDVAPGVHGVWLVALDGQPKPRDRAVGHHAP